MAHTLTGPFPIGFRRTGKWMNDLSAMIAFAKQNGFECVDVGALPVEELRQVTGAGLKIGSVDLKQPWAQLASPDAGKRKAAAQAAAEYIRSVAPLGVRNHFVCVFPEDGTRPRAENFGYAVDGYGQVAQAVESVGARIVMEGYPGGAPRYECLVATPETFRTMFREVPSPVMAINFDPSHLIRMGIDPVRFAGEFAGRVGHVHAKDTEVLSEAVYEYGHTQSATFAKNHGYGEWAWRYTIPGHGQARWGMLLRILKTAGYDGFVSIELEDESFNGTEEGEKHGLIASREFLGSV